MICIWPPLWCSCQSSWLQIQRSGFLRSSGSGTGSIQPREYNWGATWQKCSGSCLENREYGRRVQSRWPRDTPLSLALTSPTRSCRSVGIVRSRTKATDWPWHTSDLDHGGWERTMPEPGVEAGYSGTRSRSANLSSASFEPSKKLSGIFTLGYKTIFLYRGSCHGSDCRAIAWRLHCKETTRNHPHQNVLATRTQVKPLYKQQTSHI
jgi:hypothetical protein